MIVEEGIHAARRIADLGFGEWDSLLKVRDVACAKAAEGASPFFPLNGAGTLAFRYGTRELGAYLDTLGWVTHNAFGASGMRHPSTARLAYYQNVDVACDLARDPRPRTRKGTGAERRDQGVLWEDLPTAFPNQRAGSEVWYLMVAEDGAVELTRAVVRDGQFEQPFERIFVAGGGELDVVRQTGELPDDAVDFDVPVFRR